MSDQPAIILTVEDFALLDSLVLDGAEAIALIRQKLSTAKTFGADDIPSGAVILNSRVRFRVNQGAAEERVLLHGPTEEIYGMTMLLNSPRGLALIGAQTGQTVTVHNADGSSDQIFIEAVTHKPEPKAARSPFRVVARNDFPTATVSKINQFLRPPAFTGGSDDDDPGPSAA